MTTPARTLCLAILLLAFPLRAPAEPFPDAIHAYLQHCVDAQVVNAGIVVGLVDEHGTTIVGYGKPDNGTDHEVDGDTVFEIGSVTKTFTGLLLQDMVQRGQMNLDDPVAQYLPATVRVPTRNGKQITLLHLATHTSALPREPDNLDPKRAEYPCDGYTADNLYTFLSNCQLTRDPGTEFDYSSAGIAVLAQAIALKAGTDYESLVADRICRPLNMASTRVTLTPELQSRLAVGHSPAGFVVPGDGNGVLAPAGELHSTARDMLKYVSANLGLTPSALTPLMEKTHEIHFPHALPDADIGLTWLTWRDPQGTEIVGHNGAMYGSVAFAGFDKARRRGVVVMANSRGFIDAPGLAMFLLKSEWQPDHRPTQSDTPSHDYRTCVGQYRRSPDRAPGPLGQVQQFLRTTPKPAIYIPAASCLALPAILLWRTDRPRKRRIILWCALLVVCLSALTLALASSHPDVEPPQQPGIGIRSEGDRLFAQATDPGWPAEVLLPPITGELLTESPTRLFERLSGTPVDLSLDPHGKVTALTLHHGGQAFSYDKISDDPPPAPEPPKRPVLINLDTHLLDACVGHYDFPPDPGSTAGVKAAIWREGDHLVGQFRGPRVTRGAIDLYPESETRFILKIDGSHLTFLKNANGQVTDIIHHCPGVPDHKGEKVQD